ncbi:hypothetical protein BS47DRAFT_1341761 [Hydnum rufescens UP504]|uniref:Seipin n=1 Tax=Hydnum rufescens UP504 TaxID=1448309 RepID=A0A9P6DVR4_9AGAM|nr:hypothetical protein BS47DRAFT_1341761 [Hydnum rufescens UP504]
MDSQTEQELPPFPVLLRALRLRVLRILALPFTVVLNSFTNVLRVVAPLTFHIFLLASLIPFLAGTSIGVGLIIRSWISTEWREVVHLQYGEGQPPYAEFQLPEFSQIPFDISLELILPVFAKNTELGNFMTNLRIRTPSNKTLVSVTRPSLVFPPPLISPSPPYSFLLATAGVVHTHSISIPLLKEFTPSSSPLNARLEVGRLDGWRSVGNGEGREVVIAESYLKGLPRLKGVRGFFANHSLILFAVSSTSFFIISTMATFTVYLVVVSRLSLSPLPAERESDEKQSIKEEDVDRLQIKAEEDEGRGSTAGGTISGTEFGDEGSNLSIVG